MRSAPSVLAGEILKTSAKTGQRLSSEAVLHRAAQSRAALLLEDREPSRFVGHRPGTEIRWQKDPALWFQADYGIFYVGKFLKETQPGRDLNYWALWAGIPDGWELRRNAAARLPKTPAPATTYEPSVPAGDEAVRA